MTRPRIAFPGIGLMGRHQATRLLNAGYLLAASNRTRANAETLACAQVFDTPTEAVVDAAARLDLTEMPFTAAVADLFRDLLANAGDLDHSALLVELERRNHREAAGCPATP